MRILAACEFSGTVRDAFLNRGHDAWSCDLLPCAGKEERHYQRDVLDLLKEDSNWDMVIAFPPCTFLTNAGVKHLHDSSSKAKISGSKRWVEMFFAAEFFNVFRNLDVPKVCVENPIPHKYAKALIGGYTQIIQPWMFGHPETKATCLWLKGLPKLIETNNVKEHMMTLPKNERSRIHYMPPSKDRGLKRSVFFQGVADAMADQWGGQ